MGFGPSSVANAITDGWSLGVREGRKTARDATMKIFIGAELDGFVKSPFCSIRYRSQKTFYEFIKNLIKGLGDKDYGTNS